MRRIVLSLLVVGLLLCGQVWSSQIQAFIINGTVSGGKGTITVHFPTDATGVDIKVYGTKGVVVTSNADPVVNRSVKAGESITLNVTYTTPPGGTCHLAVAVQGDVFGRPRNSVKGFTVQVERPAARTKLPSLKTR